jgi:hypothetical protein
VSLVELTVVDLNEIWNDDQLRKSGESVSTKVAAEDFHVPNKLGHFQENGRRKLMNLHRKASKIAGRT